MGVAMEGAMEVAMAEMEEELTVKVSIAGVGDGGDGAASGGLGQGAAPDADNAAAAARTQRHVSQGIAADLPVVARWRPLRLKWKELEPRFTHLNSLTFRQC